MIFYSPIEGDAFTGKVAYRPRTCFLMTQLGQPVAPVVVQIRKRLATILSERNINLMDANDVVTGKDFLMKIWRLIVAVPLGVAVIDHQMSPQTLSNIFYEIGMLQAYGKESLIIKTPETGIPSDFLRTEYVEFGPNFEKNLRKYLQSFFNQAEYYVSVANQLENNPLLAIDYLRRAYLITGKEELRSLARQIFEDASIEGRAKNSVEMILADF